MEIKPGYKQTEVGVIPEDWDVFPITSLLHKGSRITYGVVKPGPNDFDGVMFVRGGDVFDCKILTDQLRRIPRAISAQYKRTLLTGGEILISLVGYPGEVALVPPSLAGANIARQVAMVRLDPNQPISPDYICTFLKSGTGRRLLLRESIGSAQQVINLRDVNRVVVVLPQEAEQRAIAEALSDVDGLLGGLDRLIAKKRNLKQAAMQQLLTGQTRLPGFHGEWEETTLGQIGECIIGLTYKPENVVDHGLLVLRSSNVQNGRLAYDDNVHVNVQVAEHLYTQLGDILVCVRNGSRALIGKCAVIDSTAVGVTFGAFMSVYRTKHWRFVLHAFQGDAIQRQIRDNVGATINQITNKDMKAFRLRLPPADEQTAIAEVLTEMDAELAGLEQRREKTRALKQAMMQELLTGRTRLL
jgi:type I restriction enzyme S subunit